MKKLSIKDLDLKGKRVFVRVDFNVPVKDGKVGRRHAHPRRVADHRVRDRAGRARHPRLAPGAAEGRARREVLACAPWPSICRKCSGKPVAFAEDCVGEKAEAAVAQLKDGDVLLLENLRFHKEEEENDDGFAKQLAELSRRALRERRVRRGAPRARLDRGDHEARREARPPGS